MTETEKRAFLQWSVASVPHPGEDSIGDVALVETYEDTYLLATIDGLGHGPEAAAAAQVAADTIRHNLSEPLDDLLVLCHRAMHATRGAAVTVARITEDGELSWVGVGNVDGYLMRATATGVAHVESPVLSGGIVGFDLPRVWVRDIVLRRGDIVVLVTDGIDRGFLDSVRAGPDLVSLAAQIIERSAKGTDDALALVCRFQGSDD